MTIRSYRMLLSILIIVTICFGVGYLGREMNAQRKESIEVTEAVQENVLIPGGMPIGIYLECEGVLVTGIEEIETEDGTYKEPAKNVVNVGDYIVGVNGKTVEKKEEILEILRKTSKKDVLLHLRRGEEYINVRIYSATSKEGEEKLGIWIKDDAQGLGTLTFMTPNSEFGALGHGIIDSSTKEILDISEGTVYEAKIQNIVKGKNGTPGGMEGIIVYNKYNVIGTITQNVSDGIYGRINQIDKLVDQPIGYPIAKKEEIEKGRATLRCTIDGVINEYDIEIKKIDLDAQEVNKGIEVEVTDKELLRATGGIVQGMSGSPILQNGKIVGAITHVFIQDSTRGYGIFIENMLEHVKYQK